MAVLLLVSMAVRGLSSFHAPQARTITDPIHHTIDLHPLAVQCVDTPEFQRLRSVGQLGSCRWVFPAAVHDRFQHSLGVAHLARLWTEHLRLEQQSLGIDDADVLCVTLAGLLHDIGHGPLSHFWETVWESEARPSHEELSCALVDRIFAPGRVDPSPWLRAHDIEFVKALIRGGPPAGAALSVQLRTDAPGVVGRDKSFLYDIVANQQSGLDVDKLVSTRAHSVECTARSVPHGAPVVSCLEPYLPPPTPTLPPVRSGRTTSCATAILLASSKFPLTVCG